MGYILTFLAGGFIGILISALLFSIKRDDSE